MPAFQIRKLFLASWSRALHCGCGWNAHYIRGTGSSDPGVQHSREQRSLAKDHNVEVIAPKAVT